ncbi:MAG: MBL fold metallo-hydrolase [Sphingomonas sp.]|uniref:MBL fold metallo-hydrolase n=1 Tax=Sphingomonas sp. TaxID=28214 RepID=UPI001B2A931F|nr:MBL fold metallo-hydrolase [Sphingomonas sp.]MBO9624249.1 MBL fold metallo-hydrolase [Sphingomonas sp.]
MRFAKRAARGAAALLLWTVVALCLAAVTVPRFLDRIYYRGPVSGHFDGERFFNPDGEDTFAPPAGRPRSNFLLRQLRSDPDKPGWPQHVAVRLDNPPARVEGQAMRATWIGHATMLVQTEGLNILTDPVWSDRTGPFGFGPARVAEPGVRVEDLPKIDLILVSHNHYDHLDLATLGKLWARDWPVIVTSLGNDAILRSAGIEAHGLDWGGSLALRPGVTVAVTRNHHWGSRWFADRNRALWSSFVVRLPHGNFFFAGDTGLGDGKWPEEAAALGPIRLAAIPIGAFRFEPGQMASGSHIGPRDALRVWSGLGRPFALPIHWGTFRLSWEGYRTPPDMLQAMLRCAGSDTARFSAVAIGQPVMVPPLGPAPPAPDMAAVEACERAGRFAGMR